MHETRPLTWRRLTGNAQAETAPQGLKICYPVRLLRFGMSLAQNNAEDPDIFSSEGGGIECLSPYCCPTG